MLVSDGIGGGRAEVWIESKFVAAVAGARAPKRKAAELPVMS